MNMDKPTRGERNNNPGNLDRGQPWQGLAVDQSSDPRFCVFKTPGDGIRALAKILLTYQRKHGLKTVRQIITRWAPPTENDTDAYVDAVASECGVDPDEAMDLSKADQLGALVQAIIHHENGRCIYNHAQIIVAVDSALGIQDASGGVLA